MKKKAIWLILLMFVLGIGSIFAFAGTEASEAAQKITNPQEVSYGFIAAGIAVGLGSIAAGIAVGLTGSAAIGALAEKPELIGKLLLIVGLAEGIAIYGLLISIMILGKF